MSGRITFGEIQPCLQLPHKTKQKSLGLPQQRQLKMIFSVNTNSLNSDINTHILSFSLIANTRNISGYENDPFI